MTASFGSWCPCPLGPRCCRGGRRKTQRPARNEKGRVGGEQPSRLVSGSPADFTLPFPSTVAGETFVGLPLASSGVGALQKFTPTQLWRGCRRVCFVLGSLLSLPKKKKRTAGEGWRREGEGGGGWGVCVGVCGSDDSQHGESVLARADYAPNWVAEHLGASSRRPRSPFPALMAGATPGRSTHEQHLWSCTTGTSTT